MHDDFASVIKTRDQSKLSSGSEITLESNLVTFVAEESRLTEKNNWVIKILWMILDVNMMLLF